MQTYPRVSGVFKKKFERFLRTCHRHISSDSRRLFHYQAQLMIKFIMQFQASTVRGFEVWRVVHIHQGGPPTFLIESYNFMPYFFINSEDL